MENTTVRTTLTLPAELVQAADSAVSKGKAKSRNDFVARAIRNELAALLRAEIDAEFAEMANDTEYQAEVEILNKEFVQADWEAFKLGESQL
jgi:metal-responsive CopG/Arc/MetJ family transcriptional regulator